MYPERDGVHYIKGYQQRSNVEGGRVITHKCVGTGSSKISTFDLQQTKIFESSLFLNRQHHCTTRPCENGEQRTKCYWNQAKKFRSIS